MLFYIKVLSVPVSHSYSGVPLQYGPVMRAKGEIKEGGSSETLMEGGAWRFFKNRLRRTSLRSILKQTGEGSCENGGPRTGPAAAEAACQHAAGPAIESDAIEARL